MYYKNGVTMRKFYIALCGGIVLSGCSSFSERHQASGNFEYLDEKDQQSIVVPQGFTPLATRSDYDIPAIGNKANVNLVGNKLDIRAPSLIMPVAPNSIESDDTSKTQVVFESFLSKEKFKQDLWKKVSHFVDSQGYGIATSQDGRSLSTRSIESDEYFKLLFGLEEDFSLSQQYQFYINVEPKGYKATIDVRLIDHQEQGKAIELNKFAKRRYESRMLNQFLSQVYAEHNQVLIANQSKSHKGVKLDLGFDNEQNTIYQIHAPYELAWEKLARVLPKLGFVVDDRDKSINTYFTHFESDADGFWSGLFSDDTDVETVNLKDKEKFQIKLYERGDISQLTIVNSKGERLSAEKMTEMLNAFSQLMAKNQL